MSSSENTNAPWRVGVLFSQTGVTFAIEQCRLNATLLAIEEINSRGGVLDRMVQPAIYDPASDPKQFRSLAERLFQVERIRLLFGCYMSSARQGRSAGRREPPWFALLSDALRGFRIFSTLHLYRRGAQSELPAAGKISALDLRQSLRCVALESSVTASKNALSWLTSKDETLIWRPSRSNSPSETRRIIASRTGVRDVPMSETIRASSTTEPGCT